MTRIKRAVDRALNPPAGARSRVNAFIVTVIALNTIAVVLETHAPIAEANQTMLDIVELVSVVIFTLEYVLRVWVADLDRSRGGPVLSRLRYALTPIALVDLVAILPTLIPLFIPLEASVVRVLRMLRFIRILKIGRYARALGLIGGALGRKKEELALTFFFLVVLLILASTLIYLAEHEVQPEQFASIPMAMWWTIVTLTTLGYGDVVPMTELGKVIAGLVAVSGVIFVALPAGIVSSGFFEQLREQSRSSTGSTDADTMARCPHCGESLRDPPARITRAGDP